MILVDASNIAFGTMLDFHNKSGDQPDLPLMRHLLLTKLKTEKNRLKAYADEIVLCFDSLHYWRRDAFPLYKAKRKNDREKSSFDWKRMFECYDEFKNELRENLPVRCVEVNGAEGDDIMAVLSSRFGPTGNVCILSSDKDLLQIQQNVCPKVKQWSLNQRKFITPANSKYDLFEHVVRGDAGDGVPNILSEDDVLVAEGKRQKPIRSTDIKKWALAGGMAAPEVFCRDFATLERFNRNRSLIDLSRIPHDLQMDITRAYDAAEIPRGRVFGYLTANRLSRLIADGGW